MWFRGMRRGRKRRRTEPLACVVCLNADERVEHLCGCRWAPMHPACADRMVLCGSGKVCKFCNTALRCDGASDPSVLTNVLTHLGRVARAIFDKELSRSQAVDVHELSFDAVLCCLYDFYENEADGPLLVREEFASLGVAHEDPVSLMQALGMELQPYPEDRDQQAFLKSFRGDGASRSGTDAGATAR